jgi:phytoene synthase
VIYAICRSGDDAVDEASSLAEGKDNLARWWQGIERAYAGTSQINPNDADNALELALSWALENFEIPKEAFYELYLGLESDLQHDVHYETLDDLMLYCRRVAGVVGFLIAPIAGYRGGEATLEQALALGQAMQLTNILRDVGEDFGKGRCYLPEDLVAKYNVNLDRLRAGYVDANYVTLLEELCDLTHGLYRQGWQGIPKLEGIASVAVGVAALNYESILRKLRQNHYDNLSRRAFLRTHERLVLIPRAVFSVFSSW